MQHYKKKQGNKTKQECTELKNVYVSLTESKACYAFVPFTMPGFQSCKVSSQATALTDILFYQSVQI